MAYLLSHFEEYKKKYKDLKEEAIPAFIPSTDGKLCTPSSVYSKHLSTMYQGSEFQFLKQYLEYNDLDEKLLKLAKQLKVEENVPISKLKTLLTTKPLSPEQARYSKKSLQLKLVVLFMTIVENSQKKLKNGEQFITLPSSHMAMHLYLLVFLSCAWCIDLMKILCS